MYVYVSIEISFKTSSFYLRNFPLNNLFIVMPIVTFGIVLELNKN